MAFAVADYKVDDQVRISQTGTVTGFRPDVGLGYDGIYVRVAEGERTLEAASGWEVELIERPFEVPDPGTVVKFGSGALALSYGDRGYIYIRGSATGVRHQEDLSREILWRWSGVEDDIVEVFS